MKLLLQLLKFDFCFKTCIIISGSTCSLNFIMPPTLKKLEGHIAFGLSVCLSVCLCVCVCIR